MSRNLCRETCGQCSGTVRHEESPRPLTPNDAGRYFDEPHREGMLVANASCEECGTKYLAWVAMPRWNRDAREEAHREQPHFDLSYRSTFNDEPGPDDVDWDRLAVAHAKIQIAKNVEGAARDWERLISSEACIQIAELWMNAAVERRSP